MVDAIETLLADLTSGDDVRAEAAALALAQQDQAVLPKLRALLDSREVDERWWAVRALAQFANPPLEWLLEALQDDSEEVRQCAALALCHHPAEESIPALVECLKNSEPVSGNLAATALIAIGAPAVPVLLDVFAQAPHRTRLEVVRALATIADARAIPVLMAALEEDSPSMAYWAEEGLERLGAGMVYFKPD